MRVHALVLVIISIVATTAGAAEPLKVGIAVTEITPPLGYPMAGYFHARGAQGVLDPLYAKAIVFKQGDESAALVVGDIIGIYRGLGDAIRTKVEAETGIPAANVAVAATHSHTGPNYQAELADYVERKAANTLSEGDPLPYIPKLIDAFAAAVIEADQKATVGTLKVGAGREDTVAFNRRFILKDGTVRTWARLDQPDVVKAAGPTDPEIGLLTVHREGSEAPTAALVNFSLHCDTVDKPYKDQYSADYPGHIERVLRRELGSKFVSVFATAPCGDINHSDPTGKTRRIAPEIGERIANAAAKALPEVEPVTPNLATRRAIIEVPLQTYTKEDLAWARDLQKKRDAGENVPTTIAAKGSKILRLHRLRTGRVDGGRDTPARAVTRDGIDALPAEVQVIRLSEEVAIVTLPGEIFVELGLAIKQASPFEHTFVIELANDSPAYVPTKKAMTQGGYEVNNSIYAAGGGEMLVEAAVELLEGLALDRRK